MSMTDGADDVRTMTPGGADDQGAGGPPPGPGGGPPTSGPPQGGGPVLAALARRQLRPPVTAPGPGNMAQGLMMIKSAVELIQQALPNLMAGSQPHKDAIKAITALSRHMPQGAPTAGVQQTQLMDLLKNTMRNALMQRVMQQRGQAGPGGPQAPGGAQGDQGEGSPGMPSPPVPSTPMPGA